MNYCLLMPRGPLNTNKSLSSIVVLIYFYLSGVTSNFLRFVLELMFNQNHICDNGCHYFNWSNGHQAQQLWESCTPLTGANSIISVERGGSYQTSASNVWKPKMGQLATLVKACKYVCQDDGSHTHLRDLNVRLTWYVSACMIMYICVSIKDNDTLPYVIVILLDLCRPLQKWFKRPSRMLRSSAIWRLNLNSLTHCAQLQLER